MAEVKEEVKQPCVEVIENKGDSYIATHSSTVEEENQGQDEGKQSFKEPGLIKEKTDEQDQHTMEITIEKSPEQMIADFGAKTSELTEVKEGEVSIDTAEKNASQGEKIDEPQEISKNVDKIIAESQKESDHVEEANQEGSQSESDQHTVEDQTEKDAKQEQMTADFGAKTSELTEVKEGEVSIDTAEKNASQGEKIDEPQEMSKNVDKMVAESQKESGPVEEANKEGSQSEGDQHTVEDQTEKDNKQEQMTADFGAKTSELTEVKEGEVSIDTAEKNASQGEKIDEPQEMSKNVDKMVAESPKESGPVEEANQEGSQSEGDQHTVEDQTEKDNKQEQMTADFGAKTSELAEVKEGEVSIDTAEKNASQGEKNDKPQEMSKNVDKMVAESQKESGTVAEANQEGSQSEGDQHTVEDQTEKDNKQEQMTAEVKEETEKEQEEKTAAVKTSEKINKKKLFSIIKKEKKKYFTILTGKTLNSEIDFLKILHKKKSSLKQVDEVEKTKFILVFCPVVSRMETDIEAALRKLHAVSDTKPAALVVLHCTNDPECVVPDSSRAVSKENIISVDCLFSEDNGLYKCQKNKDAVSKVTKWIKSKPWENEP